MVNYAYAMRGLLLLGGISLGFIQQAPAAALHDEQQSYLGSLNIVRCYPPPDPISPTSIMEAILVGNCATFTLMADLKDTVTNDFVQTWTILNVVTDNQSSILNNQNTILTELEACCSAQGTVLTITAAGTISTPGFYIVGNNITGAITIAANDVVLDLQGYVISGGANGIAINSNLERVTVKNGSINNTTDSAIVVQSGNQGLQLSALKISHCGSSANPYAISLQGTTSSRITGALVEDILIYAASSGILLTYVDDSVVEDCVISACSTTTQFVGYSVQGSGGTFAAATTLRRCSVDGCSSTASDALGVQIVNGQSISCIECVMSSIGAAGASAYGIVAYNSPGLIVTQGTIANITTTGPLATGLVVSGTLSTGVIVSDVEISTVSGGTTAIGIRHSDGGLNCIFDHLSCSNVQASQHAVGIYVDAPYALINNGLVNSISATFTAEGYLVSANAQTSLLEACGSLSISASGAASVVTGIYVQADNVSLTHCTSNGVRGTTAQGFWIDSGASNATLEYCTTTSCVGIGVLVAGTQASLYDVVSQNNSSHGISVSGASAALISCLSQINGGNGIWITGSNVIVQLCTALRSSTGILNAGSGAAIAQCFASKNTTNYSGVSNTGTLGSLSLVAGGNLSA